MLNSSHALDLQLISSLGASGRKLSVLFIFLPCHTTWGTLVPQRAMEPLLPAREAWSLNYWTAGEVPQTHCFKGFLCLGQAHSDSIFSLKPTVP